MSNVMTKVELDLTEDVPHGQATFLVRTRVQDRRDITNAAIILGINRSQFIRNVTIQAARKIIAEAANEPSQT